MFACWKIGLVQWGRKCNNLLAFPGDKRPLDDECWFFMHIVDDFSVVSCQPVESVGFVGCGVA